MKTTRESYNIEIQSAMLENDIEKVQKLIFEGVIKFKSDSQSTYRAAEFLMITGDYTRALLLVSLGSKDEEKYTSKIANNILALLYPHLYLMKIKQESVVAHAGHQLEAAIRTGNLTLLEESVVSIFQNLFSSDEFNEPAALSLLKAVQRYRLSDHVRDLLINFEKVTDRLSPEILAQYASACHFYNIDDATRRSLCFAKNSSIEFLSEFEKFWGIIDESIITENSRKFVDINKNPQDIATGHGLHIFTVVYGEKYVNYCRRFGIRSFLDMIDLDKIVLEFNPIWTFYTDVDTFEQLRDIDAEITARGIKCRYNFDLLSLKADLGVLRGYAFRTSMEEAATYSVPTLSVIPDAFYGDGLYDIIANCPPDGAAGCHHLRVYDKAFDSILNRYSNLSSDPDKNLVLIGLGLTEASLFWTRATFSRSSTRSLERRIEVESNEVLRITHACTVAFVLRPTQKMIGYLDGHATWLYGKRPDRWLNAMDHIIPWTTAAEDKFYISRTESDFFFLEMNSERGYLDVRKGRRGLFPNEKKGMERLYTRWNLAIIRRALERFDVLRACQRYTEFLDIEAYR
jgi:hypothetical protein